MKAGSHRRSRKPSRVPAVTASFLETRWARLQQVAPPLQKTSLAEGKLRIIGITQPGPTLSRLYFST